MPSHEALTDTDGRGEDGPSAVENRSFQLCSPLRLIIPSGQTTGYNEPERQRPIGGRASTRSACLEKFSRSLQLPLAVFRQPVFSVGAWIRRRFPLSLRHRRRARLLS